jgi:hypothetical protein
VQLCREGQDVREAESVGAGWERPVKIKEEIVRRCALRSAEVR